MNLSPIFIGFFVTQTVVMLAAGIYYSNDIINIFNEQIANNLNTLTTDNRQ